MINIDYLTIKAFIKENFSYLSGARIQKIRQSSAKDLVLVLRNQGESRKLYINITPDIYHIAFLSTESENLRGLVYPSKPPMFCMLLRKYLDNAKIVNITQPHYERIIEFELETKNEIDGEKTLVLAIELMGKHSNIILYDKTTSIIIGCAHNIGENKSSVRELYGGIPYIYPPSSNKKDFLRCHEITNYSSLADDYLGFSKFFANLCQGADVEEIKDYFELKNINPAMNNDEYSIFGDLLKTGKVFLSSVNETIDKYYSNQQYKKRLATLKGELLAITQSRYKKTKSALNDINAVRNRRDNTDKYKLYGELLTANIYLNKNFIKEIELDDYNSGKKVLIPLDETLSMIENSKRYYKLYSKSKRTKEKTEELLQTLSDTKSYLEDIIYSINSADSLELLDEIKSELLPEKLKDNKKITEKPTILLVNIFDFNVYIGRNNKQNDFIISKLAKDEDYWFHVKGNAGSHVLLKLIDNREPDEIVLFECCKLAKKYSSVPEKEKVGVIYTKRKYIRKPPAANLGYVTYRNEKEVYI